MPILPLVQQLQIVGQDGQRLLDDLAMLVYFYHKLATDATEGQGMLEDAATCCCGALQLLMALSNNNGMWTGHTGHTVIRFGLYSPAA